jgi:hypothetical protein
MSIFVPRMLKMAGKLRVNRTRTQYIHIDPPTCNIIIHPLFLFWLLATSMFATIIRIL